MGETILPVPQWLINEIRLAKQKKDPMMHHFVNGNLAKYGLNTVCQGARCPNRGSCYSRGTATFMILGDVCTRNCAFCAVDHGKPGELDQEEPVRLKEAVEVLGLKHVVVTSVTRDDLSDGGAEVFAKVIEALHSLPSPPTIEVLTPDLGGALSSLETVLEANPEVFSHNIETIPRLYPAIRHRASYRRSLDLLAEAAQRARAGTQVKTGFMLGLGEEKREVADLIQELSNVGVTMLTVGQYLAPSLQHYPVMRYVTVEEFEEWAALARKSGFKSVNAGPLVRSSYRAGDCYQEVMDSGAALAAD
ncbi:lipoyl synthase [Pelotomaculum isophthalicicum JI]|uniref:Lipoyl synthase n=1 Tax=Pelotomaculum isophthalicicum JI TaxID=947010 RepID=A0A9X4JU06_9FIRM|nr:lipoyl synthase [Pelotomaculum isophthalicicum]MDF9409639.1 lipoyl synthase [Pelotomaculum isophthalicicum JI]